MAQGADTVLTFLESIGRRSEAEFYLKLFRQLPKESFAIIRVGRPVLRHALGSLADELRFLADLGLFALLAVDFADLPAPGLERLEKRLRNVELVPCRHDAAESNLIERLRTELRAEQIPIVTPAALPVHRENTKHRLL